MTRYGDQEKKPRILKYLWGALGLLCLGGFVVLLGNSFGSVDAISRLGAARTGQTVETYLDPSSANINVGETVTLTVQLEDVTNLSGFAYLIRFDPGVLEVVNDADEASPGIQIHPAEIPRTTFVGSNAVDNVTGVITYAVTIWGDEPFDGSATLGSIPFRGKGEGQGLVRFVERDPWTALSDPDGMRIPATWRASLVAVGTQRLYLPWVNKAEQVP